MLGYLEYLTVKFLGCLLRNLPQKAVIYLGGIIGSVIYYLDRKHRNISLRNLKAAFGSAKNMLELKKIARCSYMNLCQTFFEVLLFPRLNVELIDRFITVEGRKHLDDACAQGRGGILLTAHFGNWELSAVWAGLKGYPLRVLAREQRQSRLNALLNQYRAGSGIKVYAKGMAIRDLMGAIRRNEFVGVLGDQDAGRRGIFINFFRRPASTHPGPILLALRTGAPVIPCFIVRSGFKHKIYISPPLRLESRQAGGSSAQEIVKGGLQEFSRILESYIWLHPEQWLWLHRRWKTQPVKERDFAARKIRIMILSDGKAGHLSQSRGIVRGFPAAEVLEVKIDFRNKFWKIFMPLLAPALKRLNLIKYLLKKALRRDSFGKLNSFFPQVIISAGSSLAVCNLLFGKQTGAKTIVCMRPGILDVKLFDLVIAPQHDHLPIVKNVLNTLASPQPLRGEDFKRLSQILESKFSLKGDKFLGLLLGGENPHFFISENTLRKMIEEIKKICQAHGFMLLLTTSRRTPIHIEQQLKSNLKDFSNLQLFISPREESFNPTGGILGLSEVVIVTEDSISMIAEAAGSGKKVVVLQIDRKSRKKTPRHLETIQKLAQKGYLRLAEADNLGQVVSQIITERFTPKALNDTEKAIERVKDLLVAL
ncbi:MAG: ELM1/GtrOC1 family putative glycosyltransferase [Candidatus Ratteibacteria bacterium]|nr:ELM1/GtrOC1 family putative glycosyltransferase [Candidatus Ratteibacteria bacterium]